MTKVRIAVAMNERGEWFAWGSYEHSDETAINEALWNIPDDCMSKVCFVEAEIPEPKAETVQGKIS